MNKVSENKKVMLWLQLEKRGCVWSYAKGAEKIDDEILIEKSLLFLEFEELYKLSDIYPMDFIKSVWRHSASITEITAAYPECKKKDYKRTYITIKIK